MTIIYCGQLVSSTVSEQDLRDWIKNRFSRKNLSARKIFLCPKKHMGVLKESDALEVPRFIFNAASFWSHSYRTVKLIEPNSQVLAPTDVVVRDVTTEGQVVVLHPQRGMVILEQDDLAPV
jgi:hypothetical protein